MKNILVWGGAGYIGGHVVRKLLDKGYSVLVVDNCRTGNESSLPDHKNLSFSVGDITNYRQVVNSWNDMDGCILLSGIVGLPDTSRNPSLTKIVNVSGIHSVLSCAIDRPVIYSGTGSSYGVINDGVCTEDTPCNPCSLYGSTKLKGEEIVSTARNGYSTRFATLMGVAPNMRDNLLPNEFTKIAIERGKLSIFQPEARRTFLSVRDAADSLIFLLENYKRLEHKVYNVGDEVNGNRSKRELCQMIQERTACEVDYNMEGSDPDARDYFFSTKRINEAGWKASITVEEELDDLVAYYRGKK